MLLFAATAAVLQLSTGVALRPLLHLLLLVFVLIPFPFITAAVFLLIICIVPTAAAAVVITQPCRHPPFP